MNIEEMKAEFGDPERIAARLQFHKRLVDEQDAARSTCDRLLTGPSRWWANAIQQEGGRTAGMVTALIERSEGALGRSPLDSLTLAEIAVDIAERIDVLSYPYDYVYKIRGQAFLRHAFVLSYLGKLREAAAAAELSEHCLKQTPFPATEPARLELVRSNIARNMEKYDEAIDRARRAADDFLWFGDTERAMQARNYEASALYSSHDYRRAREVWLSMDEYAHELSAEQRAARLHNLGLCSGAVGELDEAARYYALAVEAFDRLGLAVNRVKSRKSIASALHAAGRHAEAIPVARKAWQELEELGMEGDAALAALLVAECLLAIGRTDEVPAIARMLIDRCTRSGMSSSAMTALAFLREVVATGHATPYLVRQVREFVRDVNIGYERPSEPMAAAPRGEA
jgi:tetratricopeptide (TPR) repeat protein